MRLFGRTDDILGIQAIIKHSLRHKKQIPPAWYCQTEGYINARALTDSNLKSAIACDFAVKAVLPAALSGQAVQ